MAKRYLLLFVIRSDEKDLLFEVRERESDRLHRILEDLEGRDSPGFFYFDTVDGRSVAINLTDVQAIRYLWEPALLPPDETRHDGQITIFLRGAREPICPGCCDPVQLFDFFAALENVPHGPVFPEFEDEDGELFQVNSREVVWAVAPTHLIDEGRDEMMSEDIPPPNSLD